MTSGELYDLINKARARGYKYQEIADAIGIQKGSLLWVKNHKIVNPTVLESVKNIPYSEEWLDKKFPIKKKQIKLNSVLTHAIANTAFSISADVDDVIAYYLANKPTARQLIYWNYLLKRKVMFNYEGDVNNKLPGWELVIKQYNEKRRAYGGVPKKMPTQKNEVISDSDLFKRFVRSGKSGTGNNKTSVK